jgi:hypothetical protein
MFCPLPPLRQILGRLDDTRRPVDGVAGKMDAAKLLEARSISTQSRASVRWSQIGPSGKTPGVSLMRRVFIAALHAVEGRAKARPKSFQIKVEVSK